MQKLKKKAKGHGKGIGTKRATAFRNAEKVLYVLERREVLR